MEHFYVHIFIVGKERRERRRNGEGVGERIEENRSESEEEISHRKGIPIRAMNKRFLSFYVYFMKRRL